MDRRQFIHTATLVLASTKLVKLRAEQTPGDGTSLADEFANPPDAAYPWVYSFWMEGNVSKEGISADLEAMQRAGIRGMLFMDGALGNPEGPYRFMSEPWLEMFRHMIKEARRLGIEVNINNAPGWAGSGGPWIEPAQASQKVVISETILEGPLHFDGILDRPKDIKHGFYKDIAVLAYPVVSEAPTYRIPDFNSTKSFAGGHDFAGVVPWPRFIPTNPEWPDAPAGQSFKAEDMRDLTDKLDAGGKLRWSAPPGHWVVLRFGHTVAGGTTRSAQKEANGLECDKLSKAAANVQFAHMVAKLTELAESTAGNVIVSTHIDSWEAGSGNWTDGYREEFLRRRGYDLLPFMPVLNGIVVNSREASERFLWDFRETVAELTLENYAGHFRELAHSRGLRLSIEAYDGTCDDLRYAGRADEPMTEFWRSCYSGLPLSDLSESMVSAAHVYGRNIIGAEAFTAMRGDFLNHPATLKPMADWAFCTGVNRLCFSEWIMQPWPRLVPGVSFLMLGTVFQRSLTWWELSKPWHSYIARCQAMLRRGVFVADVCFLAPEGAPYRFTPPIPTTIRGGVPCRPEYNFDGCPAELVTGSMTVRNGKVALPSGMEYRLLVLPTYNAQEHKVIRLMDTDDYAYKPMQMPKIETMTPKLLQRIKELIHEGATVLGYRPRKSPSLMNFPECDREIERLADEIWGKDAGFTGSGTHRFGKGRIVWGSTPEDLLSAMDVPADFACDPEMKGKLNYTHRRSADGTDIYYVVNKQAGLVEGAAFFRVAGKTPELYWPKTGQIENAAFSDEARGVTSMPISLNAYESVFVVFKPSTRKNPRIVRVTQDNRQLWPGAAAAPTSYDDSFEMAVWATPGLEIILPIKSPEIVLPNEKADGWEYPEKGVMVAASGPQTFTEPGQGRGGFAIGSNGIVVFQYGDSGIVEPLLVHAAKLTEPLLVGVIYKDGIPKLYLNGLLVKTGPKSRFPRQKNNVWEDGRPFAGEIADLEQFDTMLQEKDDHSSVGLVSANQLPAIDLLRGEIWKPGAYTFHSSTGKVAQKIVRLRGPQEISGPWQVSFDPKMGGPSEVVFDRLQDWSKRPESGIRYYSGTAHYRKPFNFLRQHEDANVYLDLGKVAVMAEVKLNGKNLGILWNAPYRIDVTHVIKPGKNTLEVKVVNLWVNRLIGDEYLPEDSDREPDGGLKAWPEWVKEGKASPTGRYTFVSHRIWKKNSPLVQSGLLGPVRLIHAEKFPFATT